MTNDEITNLRALRASDISPNVVLQTLLGKLQEIEQMYVVTFDKKGIPTLYSTGDQSMQPMAALYIQEMCVARLMGKK